MHVLCIRMIFNLKGNPGNYMSPPAGDIYRSWLRVCPSVRTYVRTRGSARYRYHLSVERHVIASTLWVQWLFGKSTTQEIQI